MEFEKLKKDIYVFVKSEMNNSNDFHIETNIVEDGIVDSLAILTLVSFLEERYGIQIEFEDINQNNFNKIGSIANYVKKLIE